MKVICPTCSRPLTLPDQFAGRTTKCPACQSAFTVPGEATPVAKPAAAEPETQGYSAPKSDPMSLASLMEEQDTQNKPPDPTAIAVCPGCGAKWKRNARECKKCNYNVIVGRKLKPLAKPSALKQALTFDATTVFLYIAGGAVIYGCFWFYNNFSDIKRKGDKAFDDASRAPAKEDDTNVMNRKDSQQK